ncbi:MAG TPA: alpha/beta fold hydrolase [Kofleriaceae bacterium]|jgi:pimeloyl-ACP methyl ester carboxylesterase|nr:alpha/beta fold hydrolase [Kofleriaceae bacterium]
MQKRHTLRHLAWRSGVAAVSQAMMFTGLYPLLPHALRAVQRAPEGAKAQPFTGSMRSALAEWGMSVALSTVRPAGFLPLPGSRQVGPRPVIVLHGYAMNRANFLPLAYRLSRAGLGPILGFEYWTLGRVVAAAKQLAWFVELVQARTGSPQVDIIGHSMGGVVGRYYVTLLGGDGAVANLVTLGSPHSGTDVSRIGIGAPTRELIFGSKLVQRLAAAPPPRDTRVLTILSHADALVPASAQLALEIPRAERIVYDDLGHVALLGSRRVANEIIRRLK